MPRWYASDENDELIFAVCDRFLKMIAESAAADRPGAATAVADWLKEHWNRPDFNRERIYPLFWEAMRRGFLFLKPPREYDLARQIIERFAIVPTPPALGMPPPDRREHGNVQVINTRGAAAIEHVAAVGADLVLDLIRKLKDKGKSEVHIGLGAGFATMVLAQRLAGLIDSDVDCPSLVLHVLSAGGFLLDQPERVPLTWLGFFHRAMPKVTVVGLLSEPAVTKEEYSRVMENPSVAASMKRAREVDIVVTSLASAHDEHGLLREYLKYFAQTPDRQSAVRAMEEIGWVGEVQFRPYTAEGELLDGPVKAVTLFELADLARLAETPDKYVVLLASPCGQCKRPKTDAIVPLLTHKNLRVWTHLLTDVDTAAELIRYPLPEQPS